jgi:hypothetical protein
MRPDLPFGILGAHSRRSRRFRSSIVVCRTVQARIRRRESAATPLTPGSASRFGIVGALRMWRDSTPSRFSQCAVDRCPALRQLGGAGRALARFIRGGSSANWGRSLYISCKAGNQPVVGPVDFAEMWETDPEPAPLRRRKYRTPANSRTTPRTPLPLCREKRATSVGMATSRPISDSGSIRARWNEYPSSQQHVHVDSKTLRRLNEAAKAADALRADSLSARASQ